MASFTLSPDTRFHVGATIYCYRGAGLVPTSPFPATNATVAADGSITFIGLEDGTPYLAGLTVAGPFVHFSTPRTGDAVVGADSNGRVLWWDEATQDYLPAAWRTDTSVPRDFRGRTNPASLGSVVGPTPFDVWTPDREPAA